MPPDLARRLDLAGHLGYEFVLHVAIGAAGDHAVRIRVMDRELVLFIGNAMVVATETELVGARRLQRGIESNDPDYPQQRARGKQYQRPAAAATAPGSGLPEYAHCRPLSLKKIPAGTDPCHRSEQQPSGQGQGHSSGKDSRCGDK